LNAPRTVNGCEHGGVDALVEELTRTGLAAGLAAIGIAPATPFDETRRHLDERRAEGLHAGMQFTYRNPARSTDPGRALPGARALIVGAYAYARAPALHPPEAAGPAGRVARYSWTDHYADLRAALDRVAAVLEDRGHRTRVLADDNALVDREAAFRAGLGTYGKNTMLLLHGDRGSEFVLGAVVTDAPLPPTGPPADRADERSACGPCQRCLPACPTGALVAPGVLDARRCLAWLLQAEGDFPREHRAALGDRLYGCDECQDVCPPNRLEIRRRPPPPAPADAEATVAVLDLLDEPDDDVLLARHGRWYIARRQARHLRRNALVVLGNAGAGAAGDPAPGAGGPTAARIAATLTRYLDPTAAGADPMLRAHAAWAAARLGRADLVDPADPVAAAEVGALATPR
jgi:epoxyqueuosine reductase